MHRVPSAVVSCDVPINIQEIAGRTGMLSEVDELPLLVDVANACLIRRRCASYPKQGFTSGMFCHDFIEGLFTLTHDDQINVSVGRYLLGESRSMCPAHNDQDIWNGSLGQSCHSVNGMAMNAEHTADPNNGGTPASELCKNLSLDGPLPVVIAYLPDLVAHKVDNFDIYPLIAKIACKKQHTQGFLRL